MGTAQGHTSVQVWVKPVFQKCWHGGRHPKELKTEVETDPRASLSQ